MAADTGDRLEGTLVSQHDDTKAYKFFRISSKERISGTPYNFEANFGNDPRLDRITEVHLISASIPNVFPSISAAKGNQTFQATGTVAGAINIVVPDGFWTTANLISYLETEINTVIAPSTVAITQDVNTQKLTFTITGAETIVYLSEGSGSSLAPYIGILADSAPLAAYTTDTPPALNGETMFYIHSADMSQNSTYLSQASGNILDVNGFVSIPVTVPFGAYQNYQPTEALDRAVYGRAGRSLRSVRITLRGNGGRLLSELTDNYEMVLVVKCMYG
jgi:hypothetical protein